MESVQAITLGQPPKDPDEGDERVANMVKILNLGFEGGVIGICWSCNRVENFTNEEAARHIVESTWPRCCQGKRLEMDEPGSEPRF